MTLIPSQISHCDTDGTPLLSHVEDEAAVIYSQQSVMSTFESQFSPKLASMQPTFSSTDRTFLKTQYFYFVFRSDIPFIKVGICGTTMSQRAKDYLTAYGSCHIAYLPLQVTPQELKLLENNVKHEFKMLSFKEKRADEGKYFININVLMSYTYICFYNYRHNCFCQE